MLTNYYFAEKTPVKETFEIVERTWLPGSKHHRDEKQPAFKINYICWHQKTYHGKKKEKKEEYSTKTMEL